MMVDVFMKDGRTTFRFEKRSHAVAAMKRDTLALAGDENRSLRCWARWQPDSSWSPARVQLINRSSIAFVIQVPPEQRESFLVEAGVLYGDEAERA